MPWNTASKLRVQFCASVRRAEEGAETLRNSLVQFQGRYVARDLLLTVEKRKLFQAHVELIEGLSPVVDADFAPPPEAKIYMPKIVLSSAVAAGQMIRPPQPTYP